MKKKKNLHHNFRQAAVELFGIPVKKNQPSQEATIPPESEQKTDLPFITLPSASDQFESLDVPKPRPTGKTMICADTHIVGEIDCAENMEILGDLTGNITCSSSITLSGHMTGNVWCYEIDLRGGTIDGNINASGSIHVDAGSTVLGSVTGEDLCLNGKIKGDIQLKGALILQSNAIVVGKINVGSICVQDGAIFSGEVTMHVPNFSDLFCVEQS